MAKISCFIITKNEQARISAAINSVKDIVDEMIIIDGGSIDDTIAISQSLGAKVISNKLGYVAQRTLGENSCSNTWILNINPDEELTPELRDEIEFIFRSNIQNKYTAYAVNITTLHRNDVKPRLFAPVNKRICIYNKKLCHYSNNIASTSYDAFTFDQKLNTKNKIYHLNGIAYHKLGSSIKQSLAKANFYSTQQANNLLASSMLSSKILVIGKMLFCFFETYFIKRYVVLGFDGFIEAMILAFAEFIRLAKAREHAKIN
ncbi:MAG: glycosyltransferase family 2 protein [Rickettsiaceae bacterium]|nr:MAG: glycosyltransferase family 2 protein [Rickettsiaceae bacterium]